MAGPGVGSGLCPSFHVRGEQSLPSLPFLSSVCREGGRC
ncbi:hypothetical protein BSU04_15450 [Caballeronia sordidicola]|uniref:Uncharacterized protein n=1 Tax=Caballeronia sordidicola TaxID=196367 RepID=A0A226X2F0_CABSO|nr:hypothetical protein BSU04_15450 [Caballeronia sordidicola]